MAVQLAWRTGYGRIRNSDRLGAAPPGAETLRELMGEGPVLILMDELSIYLRKLKGSAVAARRWMPTGRKTSGLSGSSRNWNP
ncbi:MAG: hypothetical protein F4X84_07295 [Synechococcus sp. SB0662_bin_45]|uniref:ATP-binding protein n=1 Tax=Synechococcus sp. SB0676_bin_10 TaxID=2604869 RepID=A0A6B1FEQ6_9SYNE|nr:hypothetical protein [Synechococcus sp. SB0668_bin_13]MXX08963.1 hypothetical protein [Synechococcus sp. SB0667_bin_8]MYE22136.1 hypothetical protein [Synechococcus sp. SB0662_bin_45]MYG38742.1 hypothetical protein [Synechococcus sp. SB0676_bin_10]MYG64095.1 hypothetical protein [Synechococcus sp. SB0675_bin_7]MYI72240.1 hypothetical protein [Synechococcus sp. SB0673_bin_10]